MNKYIKTILTILTVSMLTTTCAKGKVTKVKKLASLNAILTKNPLVIIKFKAEWCPACAKIDKPFKKLAKKYPNIKFIKVDFDEAKGIIKKHKIKAIPTIKFIKNGELVALKIGTRGVELFKQDLRKKIKKHFNQKPIKKKKQTS